MTPAVARVAWTAAPDPCATCAGVGELGDLTARTECWTCGGTGRAAPKDTR